MNAAWVVGTTIGGGNTQTLLVVFKLFALQPLHHHTNALSCTRTFKDRGGGDTATKVLGSKSFTRWFIGMVDVVWWGFMGGLCHDLVNLLNVIHSLKTSSRSNKYLSEFPIFCQMSKSQTKQECIPVGCIPAVH